LSKIIPCKECPNTLEIIPPADPRHTIPKEKKPDHDDYTERIYECDEGHRNTIYWVNKWSDNHSTIV